MELKTPEEKRAYTEGFLAGERSVRFMSNYTEEELEIIKNTIRTYTDAAINCFSQDFEKIYKIPDWFEKVPIFKEFAFKQEERHLASEILVDFLGYVHSIVIPQYLDFLNSSANMKFYTNYKLK